MTKSLPGTQDLHLGVTRPPAGWKTRVQNTITTTGMKVIPWVPSVAKRLLTRGRSVIIDGNTLDPTLQLMLTGMRAAGIDGLVVDDDPGPSRALMHDSMVALPGPQIHVEVTELSLPGPAGEIPARHYRPPNGDNAPGLVFAHGQFSVQFFFDRLPDYIVAMYPVFGYVAYALVQRTGIFTRYNAVVGATCVAFGFLCFFEVIDTVGPQWRWWVWNTEIPTAKPSMGVVPYASLQGFSLIVPFAIALVTRISARTPAHGWQIVRNVVLASLGVWPLMVLSNVLSLALGLGTSQQTGRFIATWLLISAAAAITAYAFVGAYRTRLHDPSITPKDVARDHFAAVCAIIYLAFGALFWIAALPDYLAARNGVTPSGDPTGSLTFAVLNYLMSIAFTWGAYTHSHGRRVIGRQPLTNHRSRLAQTRNANRHIPDTATHGASRSDP